MKEKKISDYYDAVCEKFPMVPRKDIENILKFGMRHFYVTHKYGGDTLFKDKAGFWMYCGRCFKDTNTYLRYWLLKKSVRIRFKHLVKKKPFDGYYYFGLSESRFHEYTDQLPKTKKGGRRKKFTFQDIMLYKLFDECAIGPYKYFFKVELNVDIGWKTLREEFITRHLTLIAEKDDNKKIIFKEYE